MENTQVPLSGVLISISGGNYRSNNLTGSDGTLTLIKLVRTIDDFEYCAVVMLVRLVFKFVDCNSDFNSIRKHFCYLL